MKPRATLLLARLIKIKVTQSLKVKHPYITYICASICTDAPRAMIDVGKAHDRHRANTFYCYEIATVLFTLFVDLEGSAIPIVKVNC